MRHTEETKRRLREKRVAWLRNNPDKHPWKRSSKFMSAPCEHLKCCLRQAGLEFREEFQPLDDRFFSVDIAFPTRRLALEVNGEQHYKRDGTLREYYSKRHNLIVAAGWCVHEIHYARVYDAEFVNELVTSIRLNALLDLPRGFDESRCERKQREKRERGNQLQQKRQQQIECRQQAIKSMDVDFTSFGWIAAVARKLNISHTQVRRFMRQHMSEFYATCYRVKRNAPVSPRASNSSKG